MGSGHHPPDPVEGVGPCLSRRCPALGSHLAMEGFNLRTIQRLLGHKDLRMTMRYSYLAAEHLQQAVNRMDTVMGERLDGIERQEHSSETPYGHQDQVSIRATPVSNRSNKRPQGDSNPRCRRERAMS